jgi:hypothetical protein
LGSVAEVRRPALSYRQAQDHAPMGQARLKPFRAEGSAHGLGLYLRLDLPKAGQRRGLILLRRDTSDEPPPDRNHKQVAPGARVVLLLDQAGWRLSGELNIPANIAIIPLPAKCPELNPQENVWRIMSLGMRDCAR